MTSLWIFELNNQNVIWLNGRLSSIQSRSGNLGVHFSWRLDNRLKDDFLKYVGFAVNTFNIYVPECLFMDLNSGVLSR